MLSIHFGNERSNIKQLHSVPNAVSHTFQTTRAPCSVSHAICLGPRFATTSNACKFVTIFRLQPANLNTAGRGGAEVEQVKPESVVSVNVVKAGRY